MTHQSLEEPVDYIAEVRAMLRSMKGAQPVTGDSWEVYKNITDHLAEDPVNNWDLVILPPPLGEYRKYEIILEPENPELPGFGAMYTFVSYDAEPITYDLIRDGDNPYRWLLSIGNYYTPPSVGNKIYLAFYIYSTQKGKVRIEPFA